MSTKEWYSIPLPKLGREWAPHLNWIHEQRKNGMQVCIAGDRYWFKNKADLVLFLLSFQK